MPPPGKCRGTKISVCRVVPLGVVVVGMAGEVVFVGVEEVVVVEVARWGAPFAQPQGRGMWGA